MIKKFMVYQAPKELKEDDLLAEMGNYPCRVPTSEVTTGWAGGYAISEPADEQNSLLGSQLYVQLVEGERKVPPTIIKAMMGKVKKVRLKQTGQEYLGRKELAELKKEVMDTLLEQTLPSYDGMTVVRADRDRYLVETTSENKIDKMVAFLRDAAGVRFVPCTPEALLGGKAIRALSFGGVGDAAGTGLGSDFFTYLLMRSQACGDDQILIEGPLHFAGEGSGAHQVVVSKGNPFAADEYKAALKDGKRLVKAKISIGMGEEVLSCTFNSELFALTSIKYPSKDLTADRLSQNQTQVQQGIGAADVLFGKFQEFCKRMRKDPAKVNAEMQDWVDQL